jgi:ribA/ribD-fused uncharacterized protein
MPAVIDRFAGQYRFLSNFYPVTIVWAGIEYPSTEHAFNAGKTFDESIRRRIAAAATATEAKQLGGPPARGGIVRDLRRDWDTQARYEVMAQVLELKFAHPELRELLLSTGEAILIEGTTWHDTHWGICVCSRHGGRGSNHLGRLLMELRAQLRHHGRLRGVHQ